MKLCCLSDQKTNFHDKYKEVNYENRTTCSPHRSTATTTTRPATAAWRRSTCSVANWVTTLGRRTPRPDRALARAEGRDEARAVRAGHVRDERLSRCFERKSVTVCRPADDEEEWFSVLALHQNRHQRGAGQVVKGYVHEAALPSCMDLVVWGHEHECQLAPDADGNAMPNLTPSVHNPNFTVIQPGSSVATALVDGESRPKHVAILQLHKQQWKLDAIPLRTVRPFLMRDVTLADHDGGEHDLQVEADLTEFLVQQVDAMLAEVAEKNDQARGTALTAADESLANFPLLRLKINYSGYGTINPAKFGARFVEKVANLSDILLFSKKECPRCPQKAGGGCAAYAADGEGGGEDEVADEINPAEEIQGLVKDFLDDGKSQLRILNEGEMNLAVFDQFVARDERGSIDAMVKKQCKQLIEQITKEKGEQIPAAARRTSRGRTTRRSSRRCEGARRARARPALGRRRVELRGGLVAHRRGAAAAPPLPPDGDADDGSGDDDDDMMGGDDLLGAVAGASARRPRPRRRRRPSRRRAAAAAARPAAAGKSTAGRKRPAKAAAAPIELSADDDDDGFGDDELPKPLPSRPARAAASRPKRQKTAKKYDESIDDVDDDDGSSPCQRSSPASSRAASSRLFAGRRVRRGRTRASN